MTILIEQPHLDSQVEDQKLSSETNELVLDGGFVVPKIVSNNGLAAEELVSSNEFLAPEINSFGRLFRDYDAESERQKTVEEFYRLQHINQTYDFVSKKISNELYV
jgi:inositol oxygenase